MPDSQTKVSVYQHGKLICEQVLPPGEYVVAQDGAVKECASERASEGPKLHFNGENRVVEDAGSMEGTMLDGESITVPTVLMPGQRIRCGDREIVVAWNAGLSTSPEETRPDVVVRQPSIEEIRSPSRYGTLRKMARGGMGVIMTARDAILQREVVIKFMRDSSRPTTVARFYQEAQITAQLEHPNIVPVHELALNEQNQPFYTMKRVRGLSLKKVLEGLANNDPVAIWQWPLSALLTVFQKVCDAIAFAHASGVIHRDLKPDNIMLGEYGEAQVMDWGLAKLLGQGTATGVHSPVAPVDPIAVTSAEKSTLGATMSGTVIGTPQYMAPEQAKGEVALMDEQTDIYSLGAILYHILTLRVPFNGRDSDEVLENVRNGNIVPFAEATPDRELPHLPGGQIPSSLIAVCRKAMSLEKTRRYPAVKILQSEIEAYQNGFATAAEGASIWKLAGLFFRRHRTISWAAVALLVAGLIFSVNLKSERDRATVASVQAQKARQIADEQRNAAEDELYTSEMLQAGRNLADGRPQSARDLLDRHRREPSGRDLRGWEWFYLLGEANQDRLCVHAHDEGVFALAATADGARLATGGGDGEVAVWRVRGLVPEFRFRGSASVVHTVDWHIDGKLLAAGFADGVVRVWNVDTRQLVAEFHLESDASVRSVRWRPDPVGPPTLLVGATDNRILIWHPGAPGREGEPTTFATTRGPVVALDWSADGKQLADGELNTDEPLGVFNFETKIKIASTNTASGNDALTVAIDPTGKYVAAASKHLVVVVREIKNSKQRYAEALHHGYVSALAWSPDGERLASASHDGTIRLTSPVETKASSIETRGTVQILNGHKGEVNALVWIKPAAIGGDERRTTSLFSGGADGTLRAWVPNSGCAFTFKDDNWIAAANWNPGGTRIAVANFRRELYLVDPAAGLNVPIHSTHGNLFDVAWSPGGDRLATASRFSQRVETFDATSGRSLQMFGLPNGARVAWSPTGRYLAGCGREGAKVWDTKTGALMVVISRPAGCILWYPDERRLLLGAEDGAIELWDAFEGRIISTWRPAVPEPASSLASETEPPHQIFDLCWSPDRRFVAFATQDSVVGLLDARHGRLIRTFAGHTGGVRRVAWNEDGRRLATVGQDGMMRVYDPATGGQVAQIVHGLGNTELHSLDWNSDGQTIVSGGFDRTVRLWDAHRGREIDSVERLLPRGQAPVDLETLRRISRLYAQLGWVDKTREACRAAQKLAPDDPTLNAAEVEAEALFAHALDSETLSNTPASAESRERIVLLNSIHDSWEARSTDAALLAWRELARLPGASESLPLARTYLSRAFWSVTWFPSKVDPIVGLAGWQEQAKSPVAVTVNVRALCFPYLQRGPKDLLLNSQLTERGPGGKNFGMIAHAKVNLPAGKWRLRAIGGGGARVSIAGQTVIDHWVGDGPTEQVGDYDQPATGEVEITVEHCVREGTDGFQFLIEPADE